MPTFTSEEELEAYVEKQAQVAIQSTINEIRNIVKNHLDEYYKYDPVMYERQYKLLNSLDIDIKDGVGRVYFNEGKLKYPTEVTVKNVFGDYKLSARADAKKSLESAMHGTHGGKIEGVAIWDESLDDINARGGVINLIKEELIKAGIPVK